MDILSRRPAIFLLTLLLALSFAASSQELDQDGKEQSWKGVSDQYRIIDFAAAWCQPCWKALPRLQQFAAEHPTVSVVVVSVDTDVAGRDKLVSDLALTLPVLWDRNHRIAEHYQPSGMPATYVLNPKGEVVHSQIGSGSREWKEMVDFLEQALGK